VSINNAKKRSARGWHLIGPGHFMGKCCPLKEKKANSKPSEGCKGTHPSQTAVRWLGWSGGSRDSHSPAVQAGLGYCRVQPQARGETPTVNYQYKPGPLGSV